MYRKFADIKTFSWQFRFTLIFVAIYCVTKPSFIPDIFSLHRPFFLLFLRLLWFLSWLPALFLINHFRCLSWEYYFRFRSKSSVVPRSGQNFAWLPLSNSFQFSTFPTRPQPGNEESSCESQAERNQTVWNHWNNWQIDWSSNDKRIAPWGH